MNEPRTLPNLKVAAKARDVYSMSVLNSRRVVGLIQLDSAAQLVLVIDEMDAISNHLKCFPAHLSDRTICSRYGRKRNFQMKDMGIGALAQQTGCNVETIRYYERIRLLPQPRRGRGGRFRRYDADDIMRLRFIRRARQLGFTLLEVRGLLQLAGAADEKDIRAKARNIAAVHVADIRAKIADLQAMERVLTDAICECETGQYPRCPLIVVLSGETTGAQPSSGR
jgi:MerR family mercuric resistance operon transcriptional regulator